MFKVKQKISSILVACLAALFAFVLAIGVFSVMPKVTANAATTVKDTLDRAMTGVTGTSYATWSGKTGTSGAVYAGHSAGGNSSIQLRSDNNNSGIITTASGGFARQITVVWNSNTSNGRTLQIYGKNTAYSNATELYNSSNSGTLLGTIVKGTSTELTISGDYEYIGMKSSSKAMYLTSVTIIWETASSEPECAHNGETKWVYDDETKEHFEQCVSCKTEIENTREHCDDFVYSDYTTNNGTHTRTLTCKVCGGNQTENGTCKINAEYVRNGNEHTQIGTCTICGETTTVTEDCTLATDGYVALNTDDEEAQQHAVTTTCSVCKKTETTNEPCSFDEGVLDGTTLTYTCEHCGYKYTEVATMYTVTYWVAGSITETVEVADGYTTELITAGAAEGYTFVGWTTAPLNEKTETAPEFFEANTEYPVTENVALYALYTYAEGNGGAFTLVKDASKLKVGEQIVIAASGSDYALSTDQKTNNRGQAAIAKSGDTITFDDDTDVQIITLETGKKDNTWAFNVGTTGYLYAASSGSNHLKTQITLDDNGSWKIEIDSDGVATIKAQGTNTRNWLRYNSANNGKLFSCYGSGQNDVSIYMKDGATYYVTAFNTCAHSNVNEVIEEATCTESGSRTVTCLDCEAVIEAETLPALGHNYVGGFCANEKCGEQDPATIDYSGYYYISFTHSETTYYADNSQLSSNRYYAKTEAPASDAVTATYVYRLVKTATGIYSLYEFDGDLYQENITVEKVGGIYRFYATTADGDCQLLLNAGSSTKYIKFYKASNATQSNYAQDITLTPVELPAKIDQATITVGKNITLNYYVTILDKYKGAKMHFTVEGKVYTVDGVETGKNYVFSLEIPPQYIASNVKAELYFGEELLASKAKYSVKTYVQNQLNEIAKVEGEGELTETQKATQKALKQLLTDLLYYGNAAYNYYKNETIEETPATDSVENIGEPSQVEPTETDFTLVSNEEISEYPAYFTGAGVNFDSENRIYVKISTTENVTLTIDGVEAEITGKKIYTDYISATEFAKTYTFVLYHNGKLMQTLTYSVNAYVYAMNDNTNNTNTQMKNLALALYRYGVSAQAYAEAKTEADN